MPHQQPTHIVADGQRRILNGSGRDYADRLRARFTRRAAPLLDRTSYLGRVVIHYRISRFISRRLNRIAPPEALYSSRKLLLHSRPHILSEVTREATRNV